jgi:hypothetical protein
MRKKMKKENRKTDPNRYDDKLQNRKHGIIGPFELSCITNEEHETRAHRDMIAGLMGARLSLLDIAS